MTDRKTSLADRLKRATDGLVYQSECDAPVEPFVMTGWSGDAVTPEAIVAFTKHDAGTTVTEVPFDDFFADLVELQDWYGDDERATARKYRRLVRLLEGALSDLRVFKVGERNVDIYVVGRTESGEYAGVATKAVET